MNKSNIMKRLFTLFTISTLTAVLISCGDKDAENDKKTDDQTKEGGDSDDTKIQSGSSSEEIWEVKRATGDMADLSSGVCYTFDGDKLTIGTGNFKNPGKTEITDKTFSFTADGTDMKFMYDFIMNGDTMVVTLQGSNQTFYMVKK